MRKSDFWLGVGCLAVVGVGFVAEVLPAVRHGAELRAERDALETELAKPADGPGIIAKLEERLARWKAFGEGRTTPIPEESDIAGLMGQLSKSLKGAGLEEPALTTQSPKDLEEASALALMLKQEGPFPAIYQAVREIEALPRLVRIGRVRIVAAGEKRGDVSRVGADEAELLIEAFYAPKQIDESVADAGGGR